MRELWDLYDNLGNKVERQIYRGEPLLEGEFHLVVSALIRNTKGQYLISRRAPDKKGAGELETVGGAATAGESSVQAILREVKEEVGLSTQEDELQFLKRFTFNTSRSYHYDVWLIVKDFDIETLILQPEEVSEVMWKSADEVKTLISNGEFFNYQKYQQLVDEGLIRF